MALRAIEAVSLWRQLAGDLTEPAPGRLEMALRIAVICAATTLVGEMYQVPGLDLAVYIVFFITKPDRASSVAAALVLTVLLSLLLCLILGLTTLVLDHPFWQITSMTVISVMLMFAASASKLGTLAGTVALVVGYGLDVLGQMPVGELATRSILYAWLLIGLPAPIAILLNMAFAPSPRQLVQRALADRLHIAARLIRSAQPCVEARERLDEGAGEMLKRLKLASLEHTSAKTDLAALTQAVFNTIAILALADLMTANPAIQLDLEVRDTLAATLDEMATILENGDVPNEIVPPWDADELSLAPEAMAVLLRLDGALRDFATPAPIVAEKPEHKGFFQADALSNPGHVAYALKVTAAAMTCYVIYTLIDWPGIHTAFITCYIVSLGTTAETVEKLSLRLVGAMLGAAAGLGAVIWATPAIDTIQQLLLLVLIGSALAGWIAAGSERVAYIGFQVAFAYFVCVLHGHGPSENLVGARDRVIGVLLGNVVSYLLLTTIRPVTVTTRIDPAVRSVLHQLASIARPQTALSTLAALQGSIGSLNRDLRLARLEPGHLRAASSYIDGRISDVERIRRVGTMVFAASVADPAAAAKLVSPQVQPDQAPPHQMIGTPDAPLAFGAMIEAELQQLSADLSPSPLISV